MTMAVSMAVGKGVKAVICASTGNTAASAAAYSARAGITCAVVLPEGAIARGKLSQARMHGAKILAVRGNFDTALTMVREIAQKYPIELVNSVNPFRIEGQKTGSFEIVDVLGEAPDILAIPVGNAGNITAYWKGFQEYHAKKKAKQTPRMWGFQAAGAAPIVEGHAIENPKTIATAIKIGNPASWKSAEAAAKDSRGGIWAVTDDEIVDAWKFLASKEGIFCEPASAASVAGLLRRHREGLLKSGQTVVCILTGHGLKDPDLAIEKTPDPQAIDPTPTALVTALGF
jgi:threonine synthase